MMPKITPQEAIASTVLPALVQPTELDESNHRIANNLQLLSYLVSMQARHVDEPAARAVLDMTVQRICAIASVHRQIYQSSKADSVDLGAYLEDLGEALKHSYGGVEAGRRVKVTVEEVDVAPEAATAIGVIVSELVGNACKHAYRPDEPGDVCISLRRTCAGYMLEVADHGCGMVREPVSWGNGLGARLIMLMSQKLGAEALWSNAHPGTRFTLNVAAG